MKPKFLMAAVVVGSGFWGMNCYAQGTDSALKATTAAPSTGSSDTIAEIHKLEEKLVTAFNAGKAADVANLFLPDGEWSDELGATYQGRKSIEEVLSNYFSKFPGAEIALEIEGIRVIGPVAIEEGIRTMSAGDDSRALIRYVAVLAKSESGWQLASVQDTQQDVIPTAQAALAPLGWLIGEWVNEGSDARVHIEYKWDESKNFILGDYVVQAQGEVVMKSSVRIGFDPLHGRVRSWLFDSDGGIGEGVWTQLGDGWHIHSTAILPDGLTGSAIITLIPQGTDRFSLKGTDRLIGGVQEDDFDLSVVRKGPPASVK